MIKREVKRQSGVTLNVDPCRNTALGAFFYVEYWHISSGFVFWSFCWNLNHITEFDHQNRSIFYDIYTNDKQSIF